MYEVVYSKTYKVNDDGTRSMLVIIVADSDPVTLPQTGSDVGMEANEVFAPLSMLIVPTANFKIYMADSSGFHPMA